ncbi:RNA-binding transcriptional accessory protein [Gillisia sp. M10.2A]|uniref:RNA-binding transcriptional accessory protein n=1 Tax=Gillisia lutea TaxID=2909668 RepID=A0ABS9EG08_9FLAO|nr:Tex family protein [Gillisia lutea]MCF4101817.1 RNA-binding transcriptional accessory protein [Gillisia lutea]
MKLLDFILLQVKLPVRSVTNTIELLSQDATIPFIARYRKEHTGNLDEVQIESIANQIKLFQDLEKRKKAILKSIEQQNALSDELKLKIGKSVSLIELEDYYLPYKKKRKTKADAARENGLEPLAKIIMAQNQSDIKRSAERFVKGDIKNINEAIEGAKYIIAEWINEHKLVRDKLRKLFQRQAKIVSKLVKKERENENAQKYKQYFDLEETLYKMPSHRFLALHRAESEGFVKLKIEVETTTAHQQIEHIICRAGNSPSRYIVEAIEDAYKRLLKPSFTNEMITEAKKKADADAIRVFASNLEQLLMASPLGGKRILAIDPGFRSGCKVVCLDERGMLLHNETIFPHPPQKEMNMALKKIKSLVNAYNIEAISIGNGTASRETEFFIKKVSFDRDISVYIVNEAGASVYSASKIARDEFPNYDITVRGAVSIGRRLSDPLAELVKIDPKSIGVGQYQHEVEQSALKEKLDTVVMSCVNRIGVNVNTASKELLAYVSGIGPSIADNIITYRNEEGNIVSRKQLLKVPRLGEKAYEQAAGFLRIKNAKNPLDDSAVHPESYQVVEKIAKDKKVKLKELIGNKEVLEKIDLSIYITDDLGLHTLKDIVKELEKPGVDPRKAISNFQFDPTVKTIEDIKIGMKLPGIVNNITNFGCFVDIGIKESGLIHISKLANEFISDVNSVVKLGQVLEVSVVDVNVERRRIQLSLID